jgi:hypothetical protein
VFLVCASRFIVEMDLRTCMEATSDVRVVNEWNQLIVWPTYEVAIAFP